MQILSTVLTTYCIDVHSSYAAEVAQFINVVRQGIGFSVPFWNPELVKATSYQLAFGIDAILVLAFCSLCVIVYCKGEGINEKWLVRGLEG